MDGNLELIQSFNEFLPDGHKIENYYPTVTSPQLSEYFEMNTSASDSPYNLETFNTTPMTTQEKMKFLLSQLKVSNFLLSFTSIMILTQSPILFIILIEKSK